MRRFAFKLEQVLELRRYVEREWEIKLAQATSRIVEAQREISRWGSQRTSTAAIQTGAGQVDMETLRSREDYLTLIDQRVMELQNRMVTLEKERDSVREGYLEASRKRKALTKLKERREREYYKDALRDEGRTIDEIAGSQTVRRLRESEEADV